MNIIDISQPVSAATAVWPGDRPFELEWTMRQDRGDSVNVAAFCLSAHTGTHADGGFHVSAGGYCAGDLPLDAYLGEAQVVDARGRSQLDESLLELFDAGGPPRLLVRTREGVNAREFPTAFAAPTPGLARALVTAGLRLFGTDAPSVDPFDSRNLETHHVFGAGGVAILENLVLDHVEPGRYTLIALPLKLTDADSSPVRAVLIHAKDAMGAKDAKDSIGPGVTVRGES